MVLYRIPIVVLLPLLLWASTSAGAGIQASAGPTTYKHSSVKGHPHRAFPNPYGALPNPFTVKPNPYGAWPNPFSAKPNPHEAWPNPFTLTPARS